MRLFGDGYRDVERCAAVCRIIWRLRPAIVYQLAVTRRCQEIVYGRVWLSTYSVVFLACESDEYMIFGWIGVTGLFIRILFGLRVTGVPIWYQSGAPSRFRPEMAIRGFGFLPFGSVDRFIVVSVQTADIGHWELFIFELYQLCV
ncbi:hypothetical protein DY000_02031015 [Brassica cretica]|uniref:Uncharacterized protein n=1 Tax=Brassica cretica TaxID=69181 RepID=A0ABQ7DJ12_BRACR|nr:hypothetical protein DY000_02031015 [Brassica cretica]